MLAHWEKIPDYLEIYACCVLCVRVCVVYVLNGIYRYAIYPMPFSPNSTRMRHGGVQ